MDKEDEKGGQLRLSLETSVISGSISSVLKHTALQYQELNNPVIFNVKRN